VIYVNPAAQALMAAAEADFRQAQPRFEAARLVGMNLDVLGRVREPGSAQFTAGSRTFRTITSVIANGDERIGTVVEWQDRTQEVAAEKEIGALVAAVSDGKLEARISLDAKSGFFEVLARGLNGVVGTVSDVVAELRRLVQGANEGDLTRTMELDGKSGLYVSIGSGVNSLVANMAGVVARVKSMAAQVQQGAEEISRGNSDLSQRTEEQASNLEETASSMEQMTSTVKQTADNASQANQLAMAARQQAEKGGAVVNSAVAAMGGISAASNKIADIIGVIDEIAFQTNLLALNAAVEAARAGEQGRGFAVVATEVRNLAGRSATAAKEIKALIHDSVSKVQQGSRLVDESGRTLDEIVVAVKKVTDIVANIAAASREQSAGIEQVNKAIVQMDTTTQQNAALVEQAAAASQAIVEQTHSLSAVVERYRVAARTIAPGGRDDWDAAA
jgi:methyl-accepting chemotaxis protein